MTGFPKCSVTKDHIVWVTKKYRISHIYNIHKQINANVNLKKIQWLEHPFDYYNIHKQINANVN